MLISEKSIEPVSQAVESSLEQGGGSKIIQKSQGIMVQKKKYQTRIVSEANKVNLKFEEAINPLTQGLAKSISGIF